MKVTYEHKPAMTFIGFSTSIRHLGFVPTGEEQTVDGLRFTPMQYSAKADEDAK